MKQPLLFDQHKRCSTSGPSAAASVDALQGLNRHGHLHLQVMPPTEATHFVSVGRNATQGLVCL